MIFVLVGIEGGSTLEARNKWEGESAIQLPAPVAAKDSIQAKCNTLEFSFFTSRYFENVSDPTRGFRRKCSVLDKATPSSMDVAMLGFLSSLGLFKKTDKVLLIVFSLGLSQQFSSFCTFEIQNESTQVGKCAFYSRVYCKV